MHNPKLIFILKLLFANCINGKPKILTKATENINIHTYVHLCIYLYQVCIYDFHRTIESMPEFEKKQIKIEYIFGLSGCRVI